MASLPTVPIFTMCWKCDLICRPCKWQMVESVNSYMMGEDVQIRTLSYKEYSELGLEDVWGAASLQGKQTGCASRPQEATSPKERPIPGASMTPVLRPARSWVEKICS